MPTRGEIQQEILSNRSSSQDVVRKRYLKELHEYTKRDTIIYASAFTTKKIPNLPSGVLSVSLDDVQAFMAARHQLKGKELDLILHSPGGSLEAAEQIVLYLRKQYDHIRVIIPQNAMSVDRTPENGTSIKWLFSKANAPSVQVNTCSLAHNCYLVLRQ